MGLRLLKEGLFLLCFVFWLFVLVNSTAQPAYAYVDPGAGLLLFQVMGSTFAGGMFLLRKRILDFLGFRAKNSVKTRTDARQD